MIPEFGESRNISIQCIRVGGKAKCSMTRLSPRDDPCAEAAWPEGISVENLAVKIVYGEG